MVDLSCFPNNAYLVQRTIRVLICSLDNLKREFMLSPFAYFPLVIISREEKYMYTISFNFYLVHSPNPLKQVSGNSEQLITQIKKVSSMKAALSENSLNYKLSHFLKKNLRLFVHWKHFTVILSMDPNRDIRWLDCIGLIPWALERLLARRNQPAYIPV